MFSNDNRFITRGISDVVPAPLIAFIWQCIDHISATGTTMDYLQIFEFDNLDGVVLAITNIQEKPERIAFFYTEYSKDYTAVIGKKIYVIDDGDHSTMLFADEY